MKTAARERLQLKNERQKLAIIAGEVRGQAQLDAMLMRYDDRRRKIIFRTMRPFLKFDAVYPTLENTPESFATLQAKYGRS